eukprot:COSAG02_NODE_1491_length_12358_cov_52.348014_8_plen_100_part_00
MKHIGSSCAESRVERANEYVEVTLYALRRQLIGARQRKAPDVENPISRPLDHFFEGENHSRWKYCPLMSHATLFRTGTPSSATATAAICRRCRLPAGAT